MSLSEVLTTAKNIRSGELKEEAQVRQAVITPILKELGWDPMKDMFICGGLNLQELSAEYPVGSGKVDYALLSKGKPQVLIDVRPVGAPTLKVGEQLYQYANSKNIPLLVLTDGTVWDFYLCTTEDPTDRRFCRINVSSSSEEEVGDFEQFLSKKQVDSKKAQEQAEKRLEDNNLRLKAKQKLLEAWKEILNDTDSPLINFLADKVHDISHNLPRRADVVEFLERDIIPKTTSQASLLLLLTAAGKELEQVPAPQMDGRAESSDPKAPAEPKTEQPPIRLTVSKSEKSYRLNGHVHRCESWKQMVVDILNDLERRDQGFVQRLHDDPGNQKTKNLLVARTRAELFDNPSSYPDSVYCELDIFWEPEKKWWANGVGSAKNQRDKVKTFCEVAGIKFEVIE